MSYLKIYKTVDKIYFLKYSWLSMSQSATHKCTNIYVSLHKPNLFRRSENMLNKNNIYFCLSLLQQQIIIQNELDKFCNLITIFNNILKPSNFVKDFLSTNVNINLDFITAALHDAQINNEYIIGELENYLKIVVDLNN